MITQEEMLDAIREFQTPLYLFDLDALEEKIKKLRELLKTDISLCYAMKANPFLTTHMAGLVEWIEVCSPGELQICEAQKVPIEQIILSGVLKEEADIHHILTTYEKQPVFTAESKEQAKMLCRIAQECEKQINVYLRLTSGNQFGMNEELLYHVVDEMKQHPSVTIKGIHFYSGTQKRKFEQMKKELETLDSLCIRIREELGVVIEHIEYGPGFGVEYFVTEKKREDEDGLELFCKVRDCAKNLKFGGTVTFEMGRYLAAMCGSYLTKVRELKENCGVNYCLVDGGLHHLNYDGQVMAMKTPHCRQIPSRDGEAKPYHICGALCTVNDVLIRQYPLTEIQSGDYLLFERTGAYSVTEGMSLFLSRNLPAVLTYKKEDGFSLLREQTAIYPLNMQKN